MRYTGSYTEIIRKRLVSQIGSRLRLLSAWTGQMNNSKVQLDLACNYRIK